MKITGTGAIGMTSAGRSRRVRGDADFASRIPKETTAAASLGPAAPMESIEALLAVQSTPDATKGRSRGLAHGNALLDHLENIRLGLLTGVLPRNELELLLRRVRDGQGRISDPRLSEILREIELRAAVELAKLGFES